MSTLDLKKFAGREFSFYPPILNVGHNEWTYKEASWSEILVHNPKGNIDIWIPRRFLRDVSQVEEPVMIVGLNQELEYKGGMVIPHRRRVLEMPRAGAPKPAPGEEPAGPPPPPPSRSETATERKIGLLVVGALTVFVVGSFLAVSLTRNRQSGGRIDYQAVLQAELDFTAQDSVHAVVRKLGKPEEERWRSEAGERQYRALSYPKLGITVILMGADRERIFYIGAKDAEWRNVHSVKLPGGRNTDSILRSLEPF